MPLGVFRKLDFSSLPLLKLYRIQLCTHITTLNDKNTKTQNFVRKLADRATLSKPTFPEAGLALPEALCRF
jgi:hypothetical protein